MSRILPVLILILAPFLMGASVVTKNTSQNDVRYRAILIMHTALAALDNANVVPDKPDVPNDTPKIGDTCPMCKGTGKQSTDDTVKLPCIHCDGDGIVNKGDPILGEIDINVDPDPQPIPRKKRKLPGPLQKPSNVQDMFIDSYEFTMGGHQYFYIKAPNQFYCPSTGEYLNISGNWFKTPNYTFKKCWGSRGCELVTVKKTKVAKSVLFPNQVSQTSQHLNITFEDTDYSSPTDTVLRALSALNPKPHETFLDPGCGNGKAVILAALKYGCTGIGIESDPERIKEAIAYAEEAGVSDKVTFIEGDFNTMKWPDADVGYVYLFEENLADIRNKLLSLNRFASYSHQVPNLPMYSRNNSEFYTWDYNKAFAWWDGVAYTQRPKRGCNCPMCNSVVRALNEQRSHQN